METKKGILTIFAQHTGKFVLMAVLALCATCCMGQASPPLPLGKFAIGFDQAILFDQSTPYEQYGYQGDAPIFVQIWHPLKKKANAAPLRYGQLRKREVPLGLQAVYAKLYAQMDSSLVMYGLSEPFSGVGPIDFGKYAPAQVLDTVKQFVTNSIAMALPKSAKHPVILYHHGLQGLSDENFVMAEYFASRGYIFISANFHLPYQGQFFGMLESLSNAPGFLKTTIEYARALNGNGQVYFVGHSWGAQMGWCHLWERGLSDAFVSMETTIEFKKDSNEIKDKWPMVYDAVKRRQRDYPLPILMFANTQEDRPFDFFSGRCRKRGLCASARQEIAHESYTSTYFLRYFYRHRFPQQQDLPELASQWKLYLEHLKFIEAFLNAVRQDQVFNGKSFETNFFVNELE